MVRALWTARRATRGSTANASDCASGRHADEAYATTANETAVDSSAKATAVDHFNELKLQQHLERRDAADGRP